MGRSCIPEMRLRPFLSLENTGTVESEMKNVLEVCVDSVGAAVAAQEGGGDRVELCANLMEGGTTPSAGTIQHARRSVRIGLQVMIRPRGGDFCYSATDFEVMKLDVETAKRSGADGVVFGILMADGRVDGERTEELIRLARPLSVTFHRAFDMSRDPLESLETLIRLGVDRILTSGQEATALEGLYLIADLVKAAGDRIVIMPGGGITEANFARIVGGSGAREIHVAALSVLDGPMKFRNTRCFMGGVLRPPEFSISVTDPEVVRSFVRSLH
jgi:copper homeostasis protein